MNKFDEIMLKKHTEALIDARDKQDDNQIKASLKEIERIVNKMDKQERAKFDDQLNKLNLQLDKFNAGVSMLSDGLANLSAVDKNEVDTLMKQTMQKQANDLYRSMPDAPTHDPNGPLPAKPTISQATLNRLNSEELKVPTGPLKNASQKKTTQPRQTTPQQPRQPQQARQARQAQPEKLHTKPQSTQQENQQTKIPQKPAVSTKKNNAIKQHVEETQKDLTQRRKESMVDAKNDLKKAYKAVKNLIKTIMKAISKAPEQEKKLNAQDKQIIEQSAEQLAKPDVTPEQAIAHTGTILHQIENPSEPEAGVTQEAAAPEQGWLGRALNTVKDALTSASNTLGFKSAKENLKQTLQKLDKSDTHEQDKPKISQDKDRTNEQEQEPPRSGP